MISWDLSVNSRLRQLGTLGSGGSRAIARQRLKQTGEEKEVENHVARERDHIRNGFGLAVDWGVESGWLRHVVVLRSVMVAGCIFRERVWRLDTSRRGRINNPADVLCPAGLGVPRDSVSLLVGVKINRGAENGFFLSLRAHQGPPGACAW
jgi:hypothetical protein